MYDRQLAKEFDFETSTNILLYCICNYVLYMVFDIINNYLDSETLFFMKLISGV